MMVSFQAANAAADLDSQWFDRNPAEALACDRWCLTRYRSGQPLATVSRARSSGRSSRAYELALGSIYRDRPMTTRVRRTEC